MSSRTNLQKLSVFSAGPVLLFLTGLVLSVGGCPSSNSDNNSPGGPRIATWAGDGVQGDNGDGLDRTESSLNQPMELVFGPDGLGYIVDWNNHKIRRINLGGTTETLIGTSLAGDWPCQDPADPANCDLPLSGTIQGTELELNHPMDIVFAADGNAYVAAWHNHKIERYDPAMGNVTIVAGQQTPGLSVDPGPASASKLNFVDSLVFDAAGNLFATDERNNRVRRIGTDGMIMTVAGSSAAPPTTTGFSGDGGPATLAKLALAAPNEAGGSDNPPPGGTLAIDLDGNLYLADTHNHCIRKVVPGSDGIIGDGDPAEEIITTLAGSCTESGPAVDGASLTDARFDRPHDIEFGPDGRLYVADTFNNVVRAIDLTNNTVATIAGTGVAGFSGDGGSALSAQLQDPYGIAFDAAGNLYIVDSYNNRIRVVLTANSSVTVAPVVSLTVSGAGTVTLAATASDPDGGVITKYEWDLDGDGVYEIETGTTATTNHDYAPGAYIARVRATDNEGQSAKATVDITVGAGSGADRADEPMVVSGTSGTIGTIAGTGDKATDPLDGDGDGLVDGPIAADQARFDTPMDMTVGPDGRLYIMDWNGHKIRAIGSNGLENYVAFVTGTGVEGDACETVLNPDGSCPAAAAEFNHMTNVVFDLSGRMVVAAWHNSKIKRLDFTAGSVIDLCGTGNRKFEGDGSPCTTTATSFDLPSDVFFDSAGNLFIADQANQVIRRIGADGIIKTVAGNCPGTPGFGCTAGQGYDGDGGPATLAHLRNSLGQGTDPQGKITMDAAGNLYIADTLNHAVRKVVPGSDGIIGDGDPNEEIITTIAGTGVAGYSGDGGPATGAMLNGPRDVEAAPDGAIYIADRDNNCVRKIDPAGVITSAAGQCGLPSGYSGDGGPATAATLNRPYGVELDADGNLYIADSLNHRIRIVFR